MVDHLVAAGLERWHAFWTPVKAWADYHWGHNGDALRFFATVAVVVGVPILVLLALAILAFLISDRVRAGRLRAWHQAVTEAALLDLTQEQMLNLQELRLSILRANNLARDVRGGSISGREPDEASSGGTRPRRSGDSAPTVRPTGYRS